MFDQKKVNNFLDKNGLLKLYPTKRNKQVQILKYLITFFETEKIYTESEVNQCLNNLSVLNDSCLLRRELVDIGYLERSKDGKAYFLRDNGGKIEGK